MFRFLIICLFLMNINACSSINTKYYQLSDSAFRQPLEPANVLVKVRVAPYLNKDSLVYQDSEQTIHPAKYHLWAENLSQAIAQVLANKLNEQNKKNKYTIESKDKKIATLIIDIQRFQGRYDNSVLIEGNAQYFYPDQSKQKANHFAIRQIQHEDGYRAMVDSLNLALQQLALEVGDY